jgi:hypothetical protein
MGHLSVELASYDCYYWIMFSTGDLVMATQSPRMNLDDLVTRDLVSFPTSGSQLSASSSFQYCGRSRTVPLIRRRRSRSRNSRLERVGECVGILVGRQRGAGDFVSVMGVGQGYSRQFHDHKKLFSGSKATFVQGRRWMIIMSWPSGFRSGQDRTGQVRSGPGCLRKRVADVWQSGTGHTYVGR